MARFGSAFGGFASGLDAGRAFQLKQQERADQQAANKAAGLNSLIENATSKVNEILDIAVQFKESGADVPDEIFTIAKTIAKSGDELSNNNHLSQMVQAIEAMPVKTEPVSYTTLYAVDTQEPGYAGALTMDVPQSDVGSILKEGKFQLTKPEPTVSQKIQQDKLKLENKQMDFGEIISKYDDDSGTIQDFKYLPGITGSDEDGLVKHGAPYSPPAEELIDVYDRTDKQLTRVTFREYQQDRTRYTHPDEKPGYTYQTTAEPDVLLEIGPDGKQNLIDLRLPSEQKSVWVYDKKQGTVVLKSEADIFNDPLNFGRPEDKPKQTYQYIKLDIDDPAGEWYEEIDTDGKKTWRLFSSLTALDKARLDAGIQLAVAETLGQAEGIKDAAKRGAVADSGVLTTEAKAAIEAEQATLDDKLKIKRATDLWDADTALQVAPIKGEEAAEKELAEIERKVERGYYSTISELEAFREITKHNAKMAAGMGYSEPITLKNGQLMQIGPEGQIVVSGPEDKDKVRYETTAYKGLLKKIDPDGTESLVWMDPDAKADWELERARKEEIEKAQTAYELAQMAGTTDAKRMLAELKTLIDGGYYSEKAMTEGAADAVRGAEKLRNSNILGTPTEEGIAAAGKLIAEANEIARQTGQPLQEVYMLKGIIPNPQETKTSFTWLIAGIASGLDHNQIKGFVENPDSLTKEQVLKWQETFSRAKQTNFEVILDTLSGINGGVLSQGGGKNGADTVSNDGKSGTTSNGVTWRTTD